MPNWCSNYLEAESEGIHPIMEKLIENQEKSKQGETLKWFEDDRYLFDIYRCEDAYCFETKWSPAIKTAKALNKKLKCVVTLTYSEPGDGIHGTVIYLADRTKVNFDLTQNDLRQIKYIEESASYMFEGEEWESHDEIVSELIARKMKAYYNKLKDDKPDLNSSNSTSED